MAKGRGQKASEAPTNINRALSELRGLVRDRPVPLQRIATLILQHDSDRVMLSYADEALGKGLVIRQVQAMKLGMDKTDFMDYQYVAGLEDDQLHLSGSDLSKLDVAGLDLTGFDFRNTSPSSKLDLSGVIVKEDYTGTNGDEVDLEAQFFWKGTRLTRAVFFNSTFIANVFEDCDMREVNLEEVVWIQNRFSRCNLFEAFGQRSTFDTSDFDECKLDGAVLSYSDLGENRYYGCSMRGTDFAESTCDTSIFSGCDLTRANFANASLSYAWMSDCDLTGANLRRADLRGADLSGADLSGADLTGAQIGSTIFPAGFDMSRILG